MSTTFFSKPVQSVTWSYILSTNIPSCEADLLVEFPCGVLMLVLVIVTATLIEGLLFLPWVWRATRLHYCRHKERLITL